MGIFKRTVDNIVVNRQQYHITWPVSNYAFEVLFNKLEYGDRLTIYLPVSRIFRGPEIAVYEEYTVVIHGGTNSWDTPMHHVWPQIKKRISEDFRIEKREYGYTLVDGQIQDRSEGRQNYILTTGLGK